MSASKDHQLERITDVYTTSTLLVKIARLEKELQELKEKNELNE